MNKKLTFEFDFKFDMIFADPPHFLSNGGISLQSGKVVCVDKGDWDKGKSQEDMMMFNMEWLRLGRDKQRYDMDKRHLSQHLFCS